MKVNCPTLIVGAASLFVVVAGCARKTNVTTELEKATSALEQPAPAPAPPPAPAAPEAPAQPAVAPTAAPAPAPAQEVRQALAAYQSGDLEDAVTRLQKLRATRVLTPEQRIALNDAMATVMTEIYGLAAKGDARALQAVQQYEKLQTQPR